MRGILAAMQIFQRGEKRGRETAATRRSDMILTASLIVFGLASLVSDLFPPDDRSCPGRGVWLVWLLRDFALSVAVGTAIAAGIWLLREGHARLRGSVMFASGILMCVALIGLSIYAQRVVARITGVAEAPSKERLVEIRKTIDEGTLDPEYLSTLSRIYAQLRYQRDGAQVKQVSIDGQETIYQPTQEDREIRSMIERIRNFRSWGTVAMKRAALLWIVVGAVGVGVGLLLPVRSV